MPEARLVSTYCLVSKSKRAAGTCKSTCGSFFIFVKSTYGGGNNVFPVTGRISAEVGERQSGSCIQGDPRRYGNASVSIAQNRQWQVCFLTRKCGGRGEYSAVFISGK